MAVRIIFISFPGFCTCPPPPPPPPSQGSSISAFAFRGQPGPRGPVRGSEEGGSGIDTCDFDKNQYFTARGSIHWSSCVGGFKPPGRAGAWTKMGLGGRGEGFILLEPGAVSCVYTKFVNNGQRNFVKNRKNVEWNSIYNGCHSNAKLLKIVWQSVLENILKFFIIFPILAGIMETKSNKYL